MMIVCHQFSASDHIALAVGDGQNIAGFGTLARLIGHTVTALLSNPVAAIQVELQQVKIITDSLDAALTNPPSTAIGAPFLPVIVNRLSTDFFFLGRRQLQR